MKRELSAMSPNDLLYLQKVGQWLETRKNSVATMKTVLTKLSAFTAMEMQQTFEEVQAWEKLRYEIVAVKVFLLISVVASVSRRHCFCWSRLHVMHA